MEYNWKGGVNLIYNVSRIKENLDHEFIIDTGATVSIASEKWLLSHVKWLQGKDKPDTLWTTAKKPFRFGNTNLNYCSAVATTPIAIGNQWRLFEVHIFKEDVPNLLSIRGISQLGGNIDIPNMRLNLKDGEKIPLNKKRTG